MWDNIMSVTEAVAVQSFLLIQIFWKIAANSIPLEFFWFCSSSGAVVVVVAYFCRLVAACWPLLPSGVMLLHLI